MQSELVPISRPLRRFALRALVIREFEPAQNLLDARRYRVNRRNIRRNDLSVAIGQINERNWAAIFIGCAREPIHGIRLIAENKDWRVGCQRDSLLVRPVSNDSDYC